MIWLKLTEPNGNPLWVNPGTIVCMYRTEGERGEEPHTIIVASSGTRIPVSEMPEKITQLLDALLKGSRSP